MASHLHLGPALPEVLRRQLSCDARGRVVIRRGGVVVNVGRTQRIVPNRTRWLQCHHIIHWEDGGATDTANLVALCSRHHRLHHQGKLGIAGDADAPDGLVFTDPWGRTIEAAGRPTPPGDPPVVAARRLGLPLGEWRHPAGERLEGRWVWFGDAPGRAS